MLQFFFFLCIFTTVYVFLRVQGVFLLAQSGCFLIFWSVDQVLQIALGCSGSFWGSFPTVVKFKLFS